MRRGKPIFVYLRERAGSLLLAAERYPAIPLEKYAVEDIDREYTTKKPCAPYCTVSCVHRVAMLDMIRNQPRESLPRLSSSDDAGRRAFVSSGGAGADFVVSAGAEWEGPRVCAACGDGR